MKAQNGICNKLFLEVLGVGNEEELYIIWKKGSISLLNALADINVESVDALTKYSFAYFYFNLSIDLFSELIYLVVRYSHICFSKEE
jgi:hypothetical protein